MSLPTELERLLAAAGAGNVTPYEYSPAFFGPGERICSRRTEYVDAPDGEPGAAADRRTEPVPVAIPGAGGMRAIGNLSHAEAASFLDIDHLTLAIRNAERLYRASQFAETAQRLVWIINIARGVSDVRAPSSLFRGDAATAQTVRLRAEALLAQIHLGLDYFGQSYDYVPLVQLPTYLGTLDQLMESGRNVETAYLTYREAGAQRDRAAGALTDSLQNTDRLLRVLADEDRRLSYRQSECASNIRLLHGELAVVWQELDSARVLFKEAVRRAGNGCSFKQILGAAAAVATVVATGGTTISAVMAAYSALGASEIKDADGKPIEGDWDQFKYRVKKIEPVIKGGQSLLEAYGKLQAELDRPHPDFPQLPTDEAKILADRETYYKEIEPFSTLPEAADYRLAIDHYIEVASRRNNFIVEVNGIQLRRASVANMTETYAENRDRLRVGLARNANPWLSEYKEFFRDGQLSIKSAIGKTLYFANRALSLSRGENVPFNYDDRTISALEVARASILATRDELKTEYARDAQAFQNFKLDIFSRLTKSQLDNFRKSGEATFLIPTNLPFFRDRPMAMIEGVSVDLAGMPKPLRARFYHHGGSLVVNRQGLKTSFTHEPIPTIFEIDEEGAVLSDGAIVTGTGSDYVGVSPFAIWSVRVDAPPKALQRLKSLKMVMRGRSFVV